MKVSLFLPVYNLARLIRKDLRKCYEVLLKLNDNFEIIIVDDNSTDKSYRFKRVIDRAKRGTGKDLRYIAYKTGPSRRENLAKSFREAKHEIICFIDADFSCDVSYILKGIRLLEEKSADIVTASRYITGGKTRRRPYRRIFSFVYNLALRIMFNSRIRDHQCGLKFFLRDSVLPVIDEMGYDKEFIRGWFWDAELLIRAEKKGLKIVEMPVVWLYEDISTFNFRRELRCLEAIFKFRKDFGRIK